jgi:hypothetical protein
MNEGSLVRGLETIVNVARQHQTNMSALRTGDSNLNAIIVSSNWRRTAGIPRRAELHRIAIVGALVFVAGCWRLAGSFVVVAQLR